MSFVHRRLRIDEMILIFQCNQWLSADQWFSGSVVALNDQQCHVVVRIGPADMGLQPGKHSLEALDGAGRLLENGPEALLSEHFAG